MDTNTMNWRQLRYTFIDSKLINTAHVHRVTHRVLDHNCWSFWDKNNLRQNSVIHKPVSWVCMKSRSKSSTSARQYKNIYVFRVSLIYAQHGVFLRHFSWIWLWHRLLAAKLSSLIINDLYISNLRRRACNTTVNLLLNERDLWINWLILTFGGISMTRSCKFIGGRRSKSNYFGERNRQILLTWGQMAIIDFVG